MEFGQSEKVMSQNDEVQLLTQEQDYIEKQQKDKAVRYKQVAKVG